MALICIGRTTEFEMLILDEHDKLAANSMGALILTPETHATITTDELMDAELKKLCEEAKVHVIVMDSMSMLKDHDFSTLEQRILGFGRKTSKTTLLAQALMASMPPPCEWDIPDGYGDWRDFIQNPARPGRQIKKQKAPRQSFRAQMRSVNRNR